MNAADSKNGNNRRCRKRATEAITLLLALLIAGGASAQQASIGRARELIAKGRLSDAVALLQTVVAQNQSNVDARTLLGTTLALQGMRGESIAQLKEVVRLRPNSANAYDTLGMALSRFVDMQGARQAFERSLALDPNVAETHVNLALVLAQTGDFKNAGEQLDRAIQLQGNSRSAARSHYLRARVWVAQQEMRKAASELETAVKLRPDYARAWSDLGGVRHLEGDEHGAELALDRAVALDPGDETAQFRLGRQCLENGEPRKAIDHLKAALRHDPNDRATLYDLTLAYRRDGQEVAAQHIDERLSKLLQAQNKVTAEGQTIGNLTDAGMALEAVGNIRGALEKFRAALDLDPISAVLRSNYGLALCRLGRWREGAAELQEALRLDPNDADSRKALYIARDHIQKQTVHNGKRGSEQHTP